MGSPCNLVLHVLLCFVVTTVSVAVRMSKPGCQEKCGHITIPYPFGIGSNCSANASFTITCRNSTRPWLSSINMEALNISLFGTVVVKQPVTPVKCSRVQSSASLPISLKGTPFSFSARYNSLVVLGCKNSVWLLANETTTVGGCTALCKGANSTEPGCNGVNCCQTTMPPPLKELNYTYQTIEDSNDGYCGYVFPVDKKWLQKKYNGTLLDGAFGYAPLVLEWEFGKLKGFTDPICRYADDYCLSYPDDYGNRDHSYYEECKKKYDDNYCELFPSDDTYCHNYYDKLGYDTTMSGDTRVDLYGLFLTNYGYSYYYPSEILLSSTKYCSCPEGYQGNLYLPEGCSDVDECSSLKWNSCRGDSSCVNLNGSYGCRFPHPIPNRSHGKIRTALISIGSVLGGLILLLGVWMSTKFIRRRIKVNRRRKFFKRNGGLLLEQQLSATDNGLDKTKLFCSKELTRATDHYNENRILGHGGQGTVYKGMLTDGKIVAVKKSKKVEEGDLEAFINEVVILSQVNHRNVVKLLGCCLETDVPLLVYEFIPNGTLFQHIHEPSEEFPLTWGMRVRIAREVAGALAYLHSAASAPIYHRDIKSTNILLDDKYRAKVADFGTSRSISLDQTHLTTRVVGTFGYLDPEYFRSSQFTEKSDVYSFGVVMVELLTGEKAISSIRAEAGRGLALHFLHAMEENQLLDILDARVVEEGKKEEIAAIAKLARRCLNLNGMRRPTMKEVAVELEGIQMVKEGSKFLQNLEESRGCHFVEAAESFNLSTIFGSMHFDTITPDADRPLLGRP